MKEELTKKEGFGDALSTPQRSGRADFELTDLPSSPANPEKFWAVECWQGQDWEVGLASRFQCQRCGHGERRRLLPADSPPPPAAALPLPPCPAPLPPFSWFGFKT